MYDKAKAEYFAALGIDPNLEASYNNLGTLEYFKGNYAESEKWYSRVVESGHDNGTAAYNLGLAYKAQKKNALAEEMFKGAWNKTEIPKPPTNLAS